MYERTRCQRPSASAQLQVDGLFFRESVPLAWLETAAKLPGRSLHVGIALWYTAGLSHSASVRLSNINCARFGLDRNAKYRGLRSLESVGLIAVKRKLGQSPLVTILDGGAV